MTFTPSPDEDIDFGSPIASKSRRSWRRLPKYPTRFRLTSEPAKFVRPADHVGKAPQFLADGSVNGEPCIFAVPGALAEVIDSSALNVDLVYKDNSIYRVRS